MTTSLFCCSSAAPGAASPFSTCVHNVLLLSYECDAGNLADLGSFHCVTTWLTFNITNVWAFPPSPPLPSMVVAITLLFHEHLVPNSLAGECFDALEGWRPMTRNSY